MVRSKLERLKERARRQSGSVNERVRSGAARAGRRTKEVVDRLELEKAKARARQQESTSPAERASETAQMAPPVDGTLDPATSIGNVDKFASAGIESFGIRGGDLDRRQPQGQRGRPDRLERDDVGLGGMERADDLAYMGGDSQEGSDADPLGLVFSDNAESDAEGSGFAFFDGDRSTESDDEFNIWGIEK